ncbi:MAG: type II toxin-antitoxin system MqsA family antitoxin [Magnetococcales bacterium]|nr:type II toxin-antitoxin system MqsA family antitoxin [Magnetococcales bacterium]
MNEPTCHECGRTMERDTRPLPLEYKGESITVELAGWYCQCGESIHTGKEMVASDRVLNLLKARAEGLLEPARIRTIRERLGLSQRKASAIIGGGPNAFHKYEQGDVLVSRAVSNLLRLLEAEPALLAKLTDTPTRNTQPEPQSAALPMR